MYRAEVKKPTHNTSLIVLGGNVALRRSRRHVGSIIVCGGEGKGTGKKNDVSN